MVLEKEMAPAVRQHPRAWPTVTKGGPVDTKSVARSGQESPELVECPRHEEEECPPCDGTGFRPRRHCEGCGEPSGRPSEGGRALIGLKNARGKDQPMWCLFCHPEHRYLDAVWSCLERMCGQPKAHSSS